MDVLNSAGDFLANASGIYLAIAIFGSVIFAIQFIMTISGFDGGEGSLDFSDDPSADLPEDVAGLNFFSLKSIVAFITFFGWGGVFWGSYGWSGFAIALACGITMMAITTFIIYSMLKMQQTGNIKATDLIGQNGIVYLTIPGERKSGGLVTVSLPNCTRQISAVADMEIPTGAAVVVEELFGNGLFLVKPVTL